MPGYHSATVRRHLITWLLALGVLLGLQARVLAVDPCETLLAMHQQEHSDHHHDSDKPCDPSHDDHCPVEHHQQGACGHTMPLAAETHSLARVAGSLFSLSPIIEEAELAPDAPSSDLDKPPLN